LWFGEGKYVIKAMELKMLHQPLTPEQQEKYDHRFDEHEPVAADETSGYDSVDTEEAESGTEESDVHTEYSEAVENTEYTDNFEYSDNTNYADDENQVNDDSDGYYAEPEYENEVQDDYNGEEVFYNDCNDIDESETAAPEENLGDTKIYSPVRTAAEPEKEEFDIQIKPMDMGKYNTMNLQAEIAAGVKEVLENESNSGKVDHVLESIIAPMLESDTESLDYPEIDEVDEDDLEEPFEHREIVESEVFFGETGEIKTAVQDDTAELLMQQLRDEEEKDKNKENTDEAAPDTDISADANINVEPPKEIADVLAQESDGQISLVVPENHGVEKQITGQMNIEDILEEWERMKRESVEKGEEDVRRHVLEQTGDMFTEFEASVRDGLLEKIENGTVDEESIENVQEKADETVESEEVSAEEPEQFESEELTEIDAESDDTANDGTEESDEVEELTEIEDEETDEAEEQAESEDEETDEAKEQAESEDKETYEAEEETESEDEETDEFADLNESEAKASETADTAEDKPEERIEREKAKTRSLTREEKELFAPFIQSKSAKRQLVNAIDNVSMAAYTGNVIITGEEGTDTMTLAKNIVREVKSSDSNFSGRIAKITGKSLNNKNVAETIEQLANGALIVQKATWMTDETESALYQSLQQEKYGIIVIIEDAPKAMDRFLEKHKELLNSFTNRIDVEALTNDILVEYGKQYAKEREYSIDDFGVLALHTRIDERQTLNHAVTVMDVKDIVDDAIRHANRKTVGHFFDILFAKRYDEEDMIILGEKDFN
jgi:hypothetical protein